MLEQIKQFFGLGLIQFDRTRSLASFRIVSPKYLGRVFEHFEKHPLITQKAADYGLFEKAYRLVLAKEHLSKEGLERLAGIRASMN